MVASKTLEKATVFRGCVREIVTQRRGELSLKFSVQVAQSEEREDVIRVIDVVASEKIYLQTAAYQSTPNWEALLNQGINHCNGLALFVVKYKEKIIGFGRLYPDETFGCSVGNIGIVLLKPFRSKGIGTELLGFLIVSAPDFGFSSLSANVLEDNVYSRRLFSRYGFLVCDEQQIFLPHLQHEKQELLYRLDLTRRK